MAFNKAELLLLKFSLHRTAQEPDSVKLAIAQNSPSSFAEAREEALKEMSATHPAFNQILYQHLGMMEKVWCQCVCVCVFFFWGGFWPG